MKKMEKTKTIHFHKGYVKDGNEREKLFLLYENTSRDLLLRLSCYLDEKTENDLLEEMVCLIVEYETKGPVKYKKIEYSLNSEHSHNQGKHTALFNIEHNVKHTDQINTLSDNLTQANTDVRKLATLLAKPEMMMFLSEEEKNGIVEILKKQDNE